MKSYFNFFLLALLINLMGIAHAQTNEQMVKKFLERFPQADADGDGKLSSTEQDAINKRVLKRYPKADTNGDGKLSAQERQAFFRKAMARKKNKPNPENSKSRSGKPTPDHANVKYGPHERNVFDLWLAKSDQPTPLAIYIHGGGFKSGSKEKLKQQSLTDLLAKGISVASISYRLLPEVTLPTPHHDARRALQFIRHKSGDWNIDKKRVGVFGGSAGAQISMWIAYSDEMANPDSEDPVERESTRVTCVATAGGQTTMDYDIWAKQMRAILGKKYSLEKVLGQGKSQKAKGTDQLLLWGAKTPEELKAKIKKHSALSIISKDDPPIFMSYGMAPNAEPPSETGKLRGWLIHHSFFGIELKKKADSLNVENHLRYRGAKCDYASTAEFFKDKLASASKPK